MASLDNDFISISALEEKVQEQNEETLKWKNIPTGVWCKVIEVTEVDGTFGQSRILTVKTREGDNTRVWACSGLNKEKDIFGRGLRKKYWF